jgi:hypothetical protein
MKKVILLFCLSVSLNLLSQTKNTQLKISENKRYLVDQNGKPFFWLGDTAWELFHRLNREDATLYLTDRANKGFTVIQAVVWAELDGADTPNSYGNKAFDNLDPAKPNEKYFEHVDFIVNKAKELGLYVGMLPTWGDKFNKKWGNGPEVFTPANAYLYGKWLANRYKNQPIIWILGGDRNPETDVHFAIIEAMAKGIKEGSNNTQLITYHPMGNCTSATFFHQSPWLDFNMTQSGHGSRTFPNYLYMNTNYMLAPKKPTLDGEPRYEALALKFWELKYPEGWKKKPLDILDSSIKYGWFNAYDVRVAGYMSIMAGACGHTYGHNSIWQMWTPKYDANIAVLCTWKEALDYPGGIQIGYMRKFFESFYWQNGVPAQELFIMHWSEANQYNMAFADKENTFIALYSSYGHEMTVYTKKLNANSINVRWFDPVKGTFIKEETLAKPSELKLTPPAKERDWAVIIKAIN